MVLVENSIKKNKIQVPTSMAQQRLDWLTWVKHKVVAMTQVMALLLKLVMLVMLTGTTMAHKSMKAPPTKRGGADAERAMNNEMLHWHKVTGSKQKKQALVVPAGCSERTRVVGVSHWGLFEAHGFRYHFGIEFLRRSLQCLWSGLVGHESYVHDGAWSSRYFIKGTVNPRCWHLFDDAILDTLVNRVIKEAMMPTCTQEERDVRVSNIPNACTQETQQLQS